jgi:hypothetical protein
VDSGEGLTVVAEIGAQIVHALIEEHPIEVVAEILAMGDVAYRLFGHVRPMRDHRHHALGANANEDVSSIAQVPAHHL